MDAEDKAVLRRVAESNKAILAAIIKPDKPSAKKVVEIITLGAPGALDTEFVW
ncbi:hypothetical protein AGMMS50255_4190 [Spirochaetia bacterium]|nr:hypothetical protein AGMMS50255_4190 [Spirochaetia bacterium]